MNQLKQGTVAILAVGVLLGIVIGQNLTGIWPNVPLHASATEGIDRFAIATGQVEQGIEAIYFLDYLTGDLKAAVINPKTGKFNSFFTYNIAADFESAGKNARYMMVTGLTDIPRGRSGFQYAESSIYIAEATSGKVAAYTIPWSSSMQASGKRQFGALQPLDIVAMRTAFVRDEQ